MGFHLPIPECNSGSPLFQFCFNQAWFFVGFWWVMMGYCKIDKSLFEFVIAHLSITSFQAPKGSNPVSRFFIIDVFTQFGRVFPLKAGLVAGC